jgi:DNA-binding MarR family transcriptional regulator
LAEIASDPSDRRSRILILTEEGRKLLAQALPTWKRVHAEIEQQLPGDPDALRKGLLALS